jgi:hypothetical protein
MALSRQELLTIIDELAGILQDAEAELIALQLLLTDAGVLTSEQLLATKNHVSESQAREARGIAALRRVLRSALEESEE